MCYFRLSASDHKNLPFHSWTHMTIIQVYFGKLFHTIIIPSTILFLNHYQLLTRQGFSQLCSNDAII